MSAGGLEIANALANMTGAMADNKFYSDQAQGRANQQYNAGYKAGWHKGYDAASDKIMPHFRQQRDRAVEAEKDVIRRDARIKGALTSLELTRAKLAELKGETWLEEFRKVTDKKAINASTKHLRSSGFIVED